MIEPNAMSLRRWMPPAADVAHGVVEEMGPARFVFFTNLEKAARRMTSR